LQQTEDEEIEFGTRGEWIVDDVQMGENIIVPLLGEMLHFGLY
jgi:hypothetical protein